MQAPAHVSTSRWLAASSTAPPTHTTHRRRRACTGASPRGLGPMPGHPGRASRRGTAQQQRRAVWAGGRHVVVCAAAIEPAHTSMQQACEQAHHRTGTSHVQHTSSRMFAATSMFATTRASQQRGMRTFGGVTGRVSTRRITHPPTSTHARVAMRGCHPRGDPRCHGKDTCCCRAAGVLACGLGN